MYKKSLSDKSTKSQRVAQNVAAAQFDHPTSDPETGAEGAETGEEKDKFPPTTYDDDDENEEEGGDTFAFWEDDATLVAALARDMMKTTCDGGEIDDETGENVSDDDTIQPPTRDAQGEKGQKNEVPEEHYHRRQILNETLEAVEEFAFEGGMSGGPGASKILSGSRVFGGSSNPSASKTFNRQTSQALDKSLRRVGSKMEGSLSMGKQESTRMSGKDKRKMFGSMKTGSVLGDKIMASQSMLGSMRSGSPESDDGIRSSAAQKVPSINNTASLKRNGYRMSRTFTESQSMGASSKALGRKPSALYDSIRKQDNYAAKIGAANASQILSKLNSSTGIGSSLSLKAGGDLTSSIPDDIKTNPDIGSKCVQHLPNWRQKWLPVVKSIVASLYDPEFYDDGSFGPLYMRNTIHSCAQYDPSMKAAEGTACAFAGGIEGACMRFKPEQSDAHNKGLKYAHQRLDEWVKQKHKWITFADLFVLAAYVTIECSGGPVIEFTPGRRDSDGKYLYNYKEAFDTCPEDEIAKDEDGKARKKCPVYPGRLPMGEEGNLGGLGKVGHPVPKELERLELEEKAKDIHHIFTERMGISVRLTTALISGGHTFGRCHQNISGYAGPWQPNPGRFNNLYVRHLLYDDWKLVDKYMDDQSGDLITGVKPRGIRRQYVNKGGQGDLMMLVSDMALREDIPNFGYRKWLDVYAKDMQALKNDFAVAFKFATEMGWDKPNCPYKEGDKWGKFVYDLKTFSSLSILQMVDKVCGTTLDEERKKREQRAKASLEMPKVGDPYTTSEVEKRVNKKTGEGNRILVIINGQVCDLTEFKERHPGGIQIIMDFMGKDASVEWNAVHSKNTIQCVAPDTIIGHIA